MPRLDSIFSSKIYLFQAIADIRCTDQFYRVNLSRRDRYYNRSGLILPASPPQDDFSRLNEIEVRSTGAGTYKIIQVEAHLGDLFKTIADKSARFS